MKLNKSYRSGYEITELAKSISGNSEIDVVERHTERPQLIEVASREAETQLMRDMIMEADVNNPTSTAYIFKLEKDAIAFFETLGDLQKRATLLVSGCQAFTNGIVVTTSHMAKGLEFDEVVIPNVTKANYNDEMDKSLLYIACTRAMHRLKMIFSGEQTEFINKALCDSKKK
jgi:DNA helicase-2/ATP-dependent DNA helicase PcrA